MTLYFSALELKAWDDLYVNYYPYNRSHTIIYIQGKIFEEIKKNLQAKSLTFFPQQSGVVLLANVLQAEGLSSEMLVYFAAANLCEMAYVFEMEEVMKTELKDLKILHVRRSDGAILFTW
jgi:hypothetical protein